MVVPANALADIHEDLAEAALQIVQANMRGRSSPAATNSRSPLTSPIEATDGRGRPQPFATSLDATDAIYGARRVGGQSVAFTSVALRG
jgi:hypothetical protein